MVVLAGLAQEIKQSVAFGGCSGQSGLRCLFRRHSLHSQQKQLPVTVLGFRQVRHANRGKDSLVVPAGS